VDSALLLLLLRLEPLERHRPRSRGLLVPLHLLAPSKHLQPTRLERLSRPKLQHLAVGLGSSNSSNNNNHSSSSCSCNNNLLELGRLEHPQRQQRLLRRRRLVLDSPLPLLPHQRLA